MSIHAVKNVDEGEMKNLTIVLPVFAAILLSIGCQDEGSNPVSSENTVDKVLLPLQNGNQWLVQRTSLDSSGAVRSIDSILCQVEYDTTFPNEKWYKTFWGYLNNKPDGVWRYFGRSSNIHGIEYSTLQWPYPASSGSDFRPLGSNGTITVISVNEDYSTPTETFKCYHYRLVYDNTNGYQQDYYFCPGVGIVKWEDGIKSSTGKWYTCVKYELLSYVLE